MGVVREIWSVCGTLFALSPLHVLCYLITWAGVSVYIHRSNLQDILSCLGWSILQSIIVIDFGYKYIHYML